MTKPSHKHQAASPHREGGFTILELLIATTVLSVILVMVTAMMVGIGRLYSKGINQARTQDNVRSITDEIAQQLRLNSDQPPLTGTSPNGLLLSYCLGTTRYTYVTDLQIGSQSPQVLWRDTIAPSTPCGLTTNSFPASGEELIAPKSRLTAFSINCPTATSPCAITVGAAYGDGVDGDLLGLHGVDTKCLDTSGREFCATASLHTTVVRRLN